VNADNSHSGDLIKKADLKREGYVQAKRCFRKEIETNVSSGDLHAFYFASIRFPRGVCK